MSTLKPQSKVVLFDFDNTIANTNSIREIRESGAYDQLTADVLSKVTMYKPVEGILKELRGQGAKLGIVTNSGAPYVATVMKHLGLNSAFDVVITYADVKSEGKKPSPKGVQLALKRLGVRPSSDVLFVGDEDTDLIAAYHAGVTPVLPTWATRKAVSTAPAIELSSKFLVQYLNKPGEYRLFAEKCAERLSASFEREGVYFLPLDRESNVVTVKEEMTTFCLGRYFSQRAATTAVLHDHHPLSKEIAAKDGKTPFVAPPHWVDLLAHVVEHGADFIFGDARFDVITVIPAKRGKDPRLERLLDRIAEKLGGRGKARFISDVFVYSEDAKSQKTLSAHERRIEASRSLHLTTGGKKAIKDKRVLIIDDVVTTGSTLARAQELLHEAGSAKVLGLALAKTVSIMEDERQCPKCGRAMRIQKNKNTGERFWGCSGYFEAENPCKHAEPLNPRKCPKCGRSMRMQVNSHTKEKFWGCSGYRESPKCTHTANVDPSEL